MSGPGSDEKRSGFATLLNVTVLSKIIFIAYHRGGLIYSFRDPIKRFSLTYPTLNLKISFFLYFSGKVNYFDIKRHLTTLMNH
jgi:hypothetical protein